MVKYYHNYYQDYIEYDTVEWWMLNQTTYFRHIRTTQERRENTKASEEKNFYGYKVRGKRSKKCLPDAWDDHSNSKIACKSWKDLYKVRKQYLKPKKKFIF